MSLAPGSVLLLVVCGLLTALDQNPVPTFGTTVVIPGGLKGLVYHVRNGSTRLPDFGKLEPLGVIYSSELNIEPQDFRRGFPGVTRRFEWFAIDYRGNFWIERPDLYEFHLTSDDGARLYIDDQLIVDNDGVHQPEERMGSLRLAQGVHRLRLTYFQGPRFQVALVLKVAGPGESLRVFSTEEFKPPSNPETWDLPKPRRE